MSLTAVPTATPFFTSFPSKKIAYDPFTVSISPTTRTMSPTCPLSGSIEVIVGVAVALGKSAAVKAITNNIAMKVAVTLPLFDKCSGTRFPSFFRLFDT